MILILDNYLSLKKDIIMPIKDKTDNPKYKKHVLGRAIEIASRISSEGNPKHAIKQYLLNTPLRDVVKDATYALTGIGIPSTSGYNGLTLNFRELEDKAKTKGLSPKGFIKDYIASSDKIKPDIIDAITKNEKINPVIGKQVDASNGDYGIETNYIKRNFPAQKVQFIETEPYGIKIPDQNGIESLGSPDGNWNKSNFAISIPSAGINTAGYTPELGVRNDSLFVRGYDVFDFVQEGDSQQGYQNKYLGKDKLNRSLSNIVSKNTYPVVIRTPWVHHSDAGKTLYNNPYSSEPLGLIKKYPQYKKYGGQIDKMMKKNPKELLELIKERINQNKQIEQSPISSQS